MNEPKAPSQNRARKYIRVHSDRLFTEDVLARLGRADSDRHVGHIGGANVHQVNVIARHQPLPRRLCGLPAELPGKSIQIGRVSPAGRSQNRAHGQIEEISHINVCIAVRSPHEFGANDTNVELFAHYTPPFSVNPLLL
jgi:hypothetical protein